MIQAQTCCHCSSPPLAASSDLAADSSYYYCRHLFLPCLKENRPCKGDRHRRALFAGEPPGQPSSRTVPASSCRRRCSCGESGRAGRQRPPDCGHSCLKSASKCEAHFGRGKWWGGAAGWDAATGDLGRPLGGRFECCKKELSNHLKICPQNDSPAIDHAVRIEHRQHLEDVAAKQL